MTAITLFCGCILRVNIKQIKLRLTIRHHCMYFLLIHFQCSTLHVLHNFRCRFWMNSQVNVNRFPISIIVGSIHFRCVRYNYDNFSDIVRHIWTQHHSFSIYYSLNSRIDRISDIQMKCRQTHPEQRSNMKINTKSHRYFTILIHWSGRLRAPRAT